MTPSTISLILGCMAAVRETESPSQLIPSDVQRICTSDPKFFKLGI
jgi:hypothetical protein